MAQSGGSRLRIAALVSTMFAPSTAAADSPWTWGPLQTDEVVVETVVDPKVGSGVLAIFAEVAGATLRHEKRSYFILYMGLGQTLPAVGTRCKIDYRDGRLAEWRNADGSPRLGRITERFACSDARHWPDGTPSGKL